MREKVKRKPQAARRERGLACAGAARRGAAPAHLHLPAAKAHGVLLLLKGDGVDASWGGQQGLVETKDGLGRRAPSAGDGHTLALAAEALALAPAHLHQQPEALVRLVAVVAASRKEEEVKRSSVASLPFRFRCADGPRARAFSDPRPPRSPRPSRPALLPN